MHRLQSGLAELLEYVIGRRPVTRAASPALANPGAQLCPVTALAMLEKPFLLPASQNALMFHDQIAYDPHYNGLAFDESEGDRIARLIGNRSILFLANHGLIVTGATVHEAYDRLYYLERVCMMQVLAMSTGQAVKLIDAEVVGKTAEQMLGVDSERATAHFEALKRLLDVEAPNYRH